MAARPDTARKLLLSWMYASFGLVWFISVVYIADDTMSGGMSAARAVINFALITGFSALTPFLLYEAFEYRPRPTLKLLVAGVLAAALFVLSPLDGTSSSAWLQTMTVWASLAALYLRLRATIVLTVSLVTLVTVYTAFMTAQSWQGLVLVQVINCVLMIGAMLLWRWLWWVIRDAYKSREARARLAVAEERLRFARDLHDLLGHSLSVITLKSELAAKLATKDGERAAAEMAAVRALAGESLFEVQQAVHGYQALDLEEELAGVRAALEAAGASCVVEARTDGLSPDARMLLAWAVREGGTNILKHSTATRCEIRIDEGVLEMVNDGVTGVPAAPGSGLRGLSERLVTEGGSFSAGPTQGGEFLLRAAVPA
ncbi:sensor histidine kinase [Nonomuraea gerenzanensis]|uniref:Sensor histidine kinase n=1 Tax=Nonomuraea gerenzanensis TaxID=93944 RepID=A0A1M4EKS7_9ACTN|nr:histidine kinase [Nonomuraea gerenzanensis]UBU10745.1 histidine kinase [Nonomuraea gerenzanensis]SBO99173.1 sensor histidine kinase [Nonomuraea gerenzanensis]